MNKKGGAAMRRLFCVWAGEVRKRSFFEKK
jgi:hypothetical protein